MRFLCILAIARTGSTRLNQILKSAGMNTKSELFHRQARGALAPGEFAALERVSGGAVHDGESYVAWRHENPLATLDALHGVRRKGVLAFKVFPGHLEKAKLESLFRADDIGFAILSRRPIDCFISKVKAQSIGRFRGVDTADMKPALEVEEFLKWASGMRLWYDANRNELRARARPFAELTFERHIDGLTARESLERMRPLLEAIGLSQFDLLEENETHIRQDREPDYRKRVANWEEFAQALRADSASEELLQWAQTASDINTSL